MTAPRFALPQVRWLAFALVTCLAFAGLLAVSNSAKAAQKPSLTTIDLCITKSGPDKGSVRFVQAKLKCKSGELRVQVVSSDKQGVLGIQEGSGEAGPPGPAGLQGEKGPKGDKGEKGEKGIKGDQGEKGDQGIAGSQGVQGATGAAGATGAKGDQGNQGIQGVKGDKGDQGLQGLAGTNGADGTNGTDGKEGAEGKEGKEGKAGADGANGKDGEQGPPGVQGPAGTNGKDGANGANGRTVLSGSGAPDPGEGADGDFYIDTSTYDIYGPKLAGSWSTATSLIGPEGEAGEDGEDGAPGTQGPEGKQGLEGKEGKQGLEGKEGKQGSEGKQGLEGKEGKQGLQGPEGKQGLEGKEGKQGTAGVAGATRMVLSGLTTSDASSKSTNFLGPFQTGSPANSGSEGNVQEVMPIGGTLANLSVNINVAGGSGTSWTFTIRKKSGVSATQSTTVLCSISGTGTSCNSGATSVTFAAGDLLSLQVVPTKEPSGWSTMRWSVSLTE